MTGRRRALPTFADRYDLRANSFGLVRITCACGVLLAHCWPVGFAAGSPGYQQTDGQTDLGTLVLFGLVVVSGFLVADSALRYSTPQYLWNRVVRIFPGLWVCLILTAFAVAPIVALRENGNLDGFWHHPEGPFDYLRTNAFASMEQFSISGLLADTPFGRLLGGPGPFDGSLWTLRYEFACYAGIAVALATGLLRRSPRLVLAVLLAFYAGILRETVVSPIAPKVALHEAQRGAVGPFPLVGSFAYEWALVIGFVFAVGATIRLFQHRIPAHPALAIGALVVALVTALAGGFLAVGAAAWCYVVLYAAIGLPSRFHAVGRRRDYSYGVYIYAFPMQQLAAVMGWNRWGIVPYIAISTALTFLLAAFSWHVVERPAMKLRTRGPGRRATTVGHPGPTIEPALP